MILTIAIWGTDSYPRTIPSDNSPYPAWLWLELGVGLFGLRLCRVSRVRVSRVRVSVMVWVRGMSGEGNVQGVNVNASFFPI